MPVVPTPPTIYDQVTASSVFNQFRDAINFLQAPPRFELRQSSAQSIPNNTDTAINFNAEDMDTDPAGLGGHEPGTPTQWICRYPGVYLLSGKATIGFNATGIRVVYLRINNIDVPGSAMTVSGTTAYDPAITTPPKKVFLNAGDFVELWIFQNSGVALNTFVAIDRYQSLLSGLWVAIS